MEFWIIIIALVLGFAAYSVYMHRLLIRIEHALQDLGVTNRATAEWSHSTATQALHTKANVKHLIEYLEARFGHSDELRRQVLLQQVRREAMSEKPTPIESLIVTPHTPVPPAWEDINADA